MSLESQARHFRSLHQPGHPILLCNVHDIITSRLVTANPSCKALATASYAIAEASGVNDDDLTFDDNYAALEHIVKDTKKRHPDLPITADIQDGYGDQLETVIQKLIELGVVGCNLEDFSRDLDSLYSIQEATSRIKRAMETATKAGVPSFVVNARTDALVTGDSVESAIDRGKAYIDAGATTVFVWGGSQRGVSRAEVQRISDAVGGLLNVKLLTEEGALTVGQLSEIGVARISLGPGLFRKAKTAYEIAIQDVFGQAS